MPISAPGLPCFIGAHSTRYAQADVSSPADDAPPLADEPLRAVVIGCGRVGSAVATNLADEGFDVSVVDESIEAFNRLPVGFSGETFEGHALDLEVLQAAGIDDAEACVVATNGDNTNL